MSQNIEYTRLVAVNEMKNYQRSVGPIIAQILNGAPTEFVSEVKCCACQKRRKNDTLLAPSELKVIQTDYERHLETANRQMNRTEAKKVAAIATFLQSQNNILVSKPIVIANSIQRIISAESSTEVNNEVKEAFKEIRKQHSEVFVSNVVTAVEESVVAIGFEEISIQETKAGMVRIVAANKDGQNFLAEIESDKQINIHTELVGCSDGSCEKVIRSFDNEMNKRGITTQQKVLQPTRGVPVLPFAKKLLKRNALTCRRFADENVTTQENTSEQISIKR